MDLTVHCPTCHTELTVPPTARGSQVQCVNCQAKFLVPKIDPELEDAAAAWIEEDVEQVMDERDRTVEEKVSPWTFQQQQWALRHPTLPKPTLSADGLLQSLDQNPSHADGSHIFALNSMDANYCEEPLPKLDDAKRSGKAPTTDFPVELHAPGRVPHLAVRHCSHNGVLFAFDSIWMEHDGFRASMPMRCVFSGSPDPRELIARPFAFIDRSQARLRSAHEVDMKKEVANVTHLSPRKVIRMMNYILDLPRPFDQTIPYYLNRLYSQRSLICTTRQRTDGVTCEVTIPDPGVALEWLMRVNGCCGPEFAQLEHEVNLLRDDAWPTLQENCRQQLMGWFVFEPRERMILYVPEAGFSHSDAGLAGMVITDRRLAFRKYHHNGQFRFGSGQVTIIVQAGKDQFIHLFLEDSKQRVRMCSLIPEHARHALEILRKVPGLHLARGVQ